MKSIEREIRLALCNNTKSALGGDSAGFCNFTALADVVSSRFKASVFQEVRNKIYKETLDKIYFMIGELEAIIYFSVQCF